MVHVAPRTQQRRREVILRLGAALTDIDPAPERGIARQPLLLGGVQATLSKSLSVEADPVRCPVLASSSESLRTVITPACAVSAMFVPAHIAEFSATSILLPACATMSRYHFE